VLQDPRAIRFFDRRVSSSLLMFIYIFFYVFLMIQFSKCKVVHFSCRHIFLMSEMSSSFHLHLLSSKDFFEEE